ncbi:MAG: SRPBCC domain-containing protein, partial [Devosia sp.]|nr:SRPBCC domain-containing protein [Devosia sp.]
MEFGGRYLFSAPRDRVWAALNDTQVLKAAIPGCSRLDWSSATTLECEIKVNLGVMQPTFTGDLELRDVIP